MKLGYKIIIAIAVVLLIVILIVSAAAIFSSIRFELGHRKLLKRAVPPDYLSDEEISVIESALRITFPVSTSQIRTYFYDEGFLYCFAEFEQKDLEGFKSGREWVSAESEEGSRILDKYLIRPLRKTNRGFYGTEQLKWWNVSREWARWVSSIHAPNDPGGHIDIILEISEMGKIHAYVEMGANESAFPIEIFKIFPYRIDWDLRDSKPYPKQKNDGTTTP